MFCAVKRTDKLNDSIYRNLNGQKTGYLVKVSLKKQFDLINLSIITIKNYMSINSKQQFTNFLVYHYCLIDSQKKIAMPPEFLLEYK